MPGRLKILALRILAFERDAERMQLGCHLTTGYSRVFVHKLAGDRFIDRFNQNAIKKLA